MAAPTLLPSKPRQGGLVVIGSIEAATNQANNALWTIALIRMRSGATP
jgi:hypothetical protein